MAFEVVASSRVDTRKTTSWGYVRSAGFQIGLILLFLAMVGILSMFNARPIIVGYLTLGYATLGILFLTAGIMVARARAFPDVTRTFLGGMLAGLLALGIVAVFAAGA